jgi:hypothetical protein
MINARKPLIPKKKDAPYLLICGRPESAGITSAGG